MRYKKIFGIILLILIFLPTVIASAAVSSNIPEFNPLCWHEKDCCEARASFLATTCDKLSEPIKKGGWVSESPCVGDWGKCLPAGQTVTSISFGGKSRFLHVGEFIQYMYKYLIGIAGIVAVVVLMLSGFQYITSGGNSEAITSARKRIGGALMGLFLAYTSYFILNAINPALVNLRLPQVWLLRKQNMVPEFCSVAPIGTQFAKFAEPKEQKKAVPEIFSLESLQYDFTYNSTSTDNTSPSSTAKVFACGSRLFMKGGGKQTCFGDFCDSGVCFSWSNGDGASYQCMSGLLAGYISGTAGGTSNLVIDNDLVLNVMCLNGTIEKVEGIDVDSSLKPARYIFANTNKSEISNLCGGKDNIKGFFLYAEVNDETGLTGRAMEGFPYSWGTDDWHVVGKDGPGSHTCNTNLATIGNSIVKQFPTCTGQGGSAEACAAGFMEEATPENLKKLGKNSEFLKHLITYEELEKGFTCNLNISRNDFPAL